MLELKNRPRRLRANEGIRSLVNEVRIHPKNFIYPLFIVEGQNIKNEITSMPDNYHFSVDQLLFELEEVSKANVSGVMLFGIPNEKDEVGSGAYSEQGIVQKALKEAKKRFPELIFSADVCLCEYTSHGHCGVIKEGQVDNDNTLELLKKTALSLSEAGADIIAPSDMMDGRVGVIRKALDKQGFDNKIIMSYSAKYSSAFYGPFRDAAGSTPSFGDRKTYQMDYHRKKEAMLEIALDIEEGADIIMVKPAMPYLDIIKEASTRFNIPLAAYQVSGEYCMLKAAAQNGWMNEEAAAMEALSAIKRAGADIIISYYAKKVKEWL